MYRVSRRRPNPNIHHALAATTIMALASVMTPRSLDAQGARPTATASAPAGDLESNVWRLTNVGPRRPELFHGGAADVIVRLHGEVCSGTPITGTVYVVTAAHCVLTDTGEITQ